MHGHGRLAGNGPLPGVVNGSKFYFNPLPPGGIHAHAMACLAYIPGGMCIHDIFIRKQEKVLNWKVIMNNKRQSDGTQKKKNRMFYT